MVCKIVCAIVTPYEATHISASSPESLVLKATYKFALFYTSFCFAHIFRSFCLVWRLFKV